MQWAQAAASGKGIGRTPELLGRLIEEMADLVRSPEAEDQTLDHGDALKVAAKTELPVREGAKRILRAMAR